MREDFGDICIGALQHCRPRVVTIPTNGIMTERICRTVERIARSAGRTKVIVNLSLDGIGEKHDKIRGVPGCFGKVTKTFECLKGLRMPNLQVGYHTVISRHNVHDVQEIFKYCLSTGADSYVTEIAEERVELGTVGSGITPSPDDYRQAAEFLIRAGEQMDVEGFSGLIRYLRKRYYKYVMDMVSGGSDWMRCYAGIASGQLNFNGDVWFCCMKAEPVGNLKDEGYNFRKLWFGERAVKQREIMAAGSCRCPMANVFYSNVLLNPGRLFRWT